MKSSTYVDRTSEKAVEGQVWAHFNLTLKQMLDATGMDRLDLMMLLYGDPSDDRGRWLLQHQLPDPGWWECTLQQLEQIFGLDAEHWLAHVEEDGFLAQESMLPEWPDRVDTPL